jgi:hypothetical protein
MPTPIYTVENTKPAYQLDWSLTVFWKRLIGSDSWLAELQAGTKKDGVRVLSHHFSTKGCSQFLLSTLPTVRPVDAVRSVKGRLQTLLRRTMVQAFLRNYDLHSVGSTTREKAEAYVASQLEHHSATVGEVLHHLADLQFSDPDVDLSAAQYSAHARHRCNLHLSFVHDGRSRVIWIPQLTAARNMILRACAAHGIRLSRIGLLPDHLHLIVGLSHETAPIDAALSLMNNIAFVYDMRPILMPSCFLGTIGEYNLGAVRG